MGALHSKRGKTTPNIVNSFLVVENLPQTWEILHQTWEQLHQTRKTPALNMKNAVLSVENYHKHQSTEPKIKNWTKYLQTLQHICRNREPKLEPYNIATDVKEFLYKTYRNLQ